MDEVKITIEGEGLSLTKYTTLQKAGQIISFLGVGQILRSDEQTTASEMPLLPERYAQPKDIIFQSGAKTYPQKIAALAVYLRDKLQQATFSPQELKALFRKMGDEPKNFARDMREAVSRQYIHCTDAARDQYELTSKGDDAVREGFSGSTPKIGGSRKAGGHRGIREEIKQLENSASLEGYPDYHVLPTKGDKILWILQYAADKNVKALTPSEVDFLSTELGDRIEAKGFTPLNVKNMKRSYVVKTQEGFRIQKRGTDYLKLLDENSANQKS